jgi:transposase
VTANPTILTAISDVPAKAVNIRRIHRSSSSDSAVIIRRKPRSRSVGIHKKKGEGNTRNGNKYLAWAFVEAANFALRCCPQAKSFYDRKKSKTNRVLAIKALGAQAGAGVLPHAAGPKTLRCEPMFRVTVWPKVVSQESGLM